MAAHSLSYRSATLLRQAVGLLPSVRPRDCTYMMDRSQASLCVRTARKGPRLPSGNWSSSRGSYDVYVRRVRHVDGSLPLRVQRTFLNPKNGQKLV